MRFFFLFLIFSLKLIAEPPTVLVSVAPYKFFIEKIAKDTVQVQLIVPQGASSHTFEPSAKQMIAASSALIWFQIGEPFEARATQAFKSHIKHMTFVDLKQGLPLIQGDERQGCACCPGSVDLHFWLSARLAKIEAKTIADSLSSKFPDQAPFYQKNLIEFQNELDALDHQIGSILKDLQHRSILVSHPAYAYFCRDYGLRQYSIEYEGKDPTPQQMTKLLSEMKALHIHTIFIQKQYGNKAAKLVAETLGANLVTLDPYSEHFFAAMLEIAHAFAAQ